MYFQRHLYARSPRAFMRRTLPLAAKSAFLKSVLHTRHAFYFCTCAHVQKQPRKMPRFVPHFHASRHAPRTSHAAQNARFSLFVRAHAAAVSCRAHRPPFHVPRHAPRHQTPSPPVMRHAATNVCTHISSTSRLHHHAARFLSPSHAHIGHDTFELYARSTVASMRNTSRRRHYSIPRLSGFGYRPSSLYHFHVGTMARRYKISRLSRSYA